MISALALVAYAIVIAVWVPRALTRGNVADQAPRMFLALWQLATASLIMAVLGVVVTAAVPSIVLHDGLSHVLNSCFDAVRGQYSSTWTVVVALAGAAALAGFATRLAAAYVPGVARARSTRRRQRDLVMLVGRRDADLGVVVIDHPVAAAYCIPGRRGRIVVTSGAVDRLDPDELTAVIAHEAAHMRGRHHLLLDASAALARAFPFVPLLRDAKTESSRLIEMLADDTAVRTASRTTVANALVQLGSSPAPASALGAGGSTAAKRVRRLLGPARPVNRLLVAGVIAVGATLVTAPVAIAAAPAVVAHHVDICSPDHGQH